jgi:hypothetical protein
MEDDLESKSTSELGAAEPIPVSVVSEDQN